METRPNENILVNGDRPGGKRQSHSEALHHKHKLYLGIDVGSTSSDVVILDEGFNVIFCELLDDTCKEFHFVMLEFAFCFKIWLKPDETDFYGEDSVKLEVVSFFHQQHQRPQ